MKGFEGKPSSGYFYYKVVTIGDLGGRGNMHDKITDIQDSFKKAYTEFKKTKDMSKYNNNMDAMFEKYQDDGVALNFCKSLLVAWAPVINELKGGCHEKKSRIKIISR